MCKLKGCKDWLALVTAIISLLASILGFIYNAGKTSEQERKIDELAGYAGITIKIDNPNDNEQVGKEIFVNGSATPSEICRYVFVIVRNKSVPAWKVTDMVQTDGLGRWSAVASINDISNVGSEIEISALITNRPNDYTINKILSAPPSRGVISNNIIQVRRIE